ncbi:hypothetical protein [Streptomyces sp. WAC01280]|uniref:hypothetical protein n=1 Tax=Streptomyces sp. WAC01280 TaxID=2487424 RepID=UPI000F7B6823|nr:hypothetical protein [Streptomyces sp. WAC01280]RSS59837.1 hypothetical protein EF909_08225 [Streptomyces sp. WAC01280]
MSVSITKTNGHAAEITWEPGDDPHGHLARVVESDQLAYALQLLGGAKAGDDETPEAALQAAVHTTALARLLERRAAIQVVRLRDKFGMSWRQIAAAIHEDPDKQSTVRGQYESGRRHIGLG